MKISSDTEKLGSVDSELVESSKRKYGSITDIPPALAESLKNGDVDAFEKLYKHFSRPLYDFVNRMLNDAAEAENIVHDTFEYILVNRHYIDFSRGIKGYLYKCTKNKVINYIKRRKALERYQVMPGLDHDSEPAHEEAIITEEIALIIEMAILNMPERRRQVVEMYRKEGKSNKEIAMELGISEGAVSQHLAAAKNDLRNILQIVVFFLMV